LWLLLAVPAGFTQTPGPPPSPPPASSPSEIDRRTAADLYRKARALSDPSQEKVDLLTEATALDPASYAYAVALQAASQALLEKKQADVKQQEQQAKDRKQNEAAKAAAGQAQDKLDEALALRRQGQLAQAKEAAQQAGELAKTSNDPRLVEQTARLVRAVDQDVAFRKNLWRGLAGFIVAGAVLAVLFLKKRTRRLEMVEGPEPGRVFKLEKELTTIGALAPDADIVVSDEYRNVSRCHCQVARSGRHFFLVDCSRNGTFLNGRAVPKNKPVLLHANDEITLCDSVILIYR
jgi:hypothetical protein